jgi:glycosyltransferase involved in cell wall biosynthesis
VSVSVVVPTYNMARYLDDALESVFAQTRLPQEVIVVDDGSADETPVIVQRWRDRIRYVRQEHAGVSAARNAGIRESSGAYIAFLDADDLWAPEKLAAQLPLLEQDPAVGLVCSDFAVQSADGRIRPSYFGTSTPRWVDGDVFDRVLEGCSIPPSTAVVRRSAVEPLGGFDRALVVGEDLHLFLRIAYAWKVLAVRTALCTKRQWPGGARPLDETVSGSLRMLDRLVQALPNLSRRRRRLIRLRRAALELELGRYRVRAGRAAEGRRDLARAVRDNPLSARSLAWLALSFVSPGARCGPRPP